MNLAGFQYLDLDLLVILIAYLFLHYGKSAVCIFAFGQGLLVDIFSGGMHGLFTLLYLSSFGAIYLGSQFINLHEIKGQLFIVFLAVSFEKAVCLVVFTLGGGNPSVFYWQSCVSAIGTGAIAPLLFSLLNRLTRAFHKTSSGVSIKQLQIPT